MGTTRSGTAYTGRVIQRRTRKRPIRRRTLGDLVRLPGEVRNMVYDHLLAEKPVVLTYREYIVLKQRRDGDQRDPATGLRVHWKQALTYKIHHKLGLPDKWRTRDRPDPQVLPARNIHEDATKNAIYHNERRYGTDNTLEKLRGTMIGSELAYYKINRGVILDNVVLFVVDRTNCRTYGFGYEISVPIYVDIFNGIRNAVFHLDVDDISTAHKQYYDTIITVGANRILMCLTQNSTTRHQSLDTLVVHMRLKREIPKSRWEEIGYDHFQYAYTALEVLAGLTGNRIQRHYPNLSRIMVRVIQVDNDAVEQFTEYNWAVQHNVALAFWNCRQDGPHPHNINTLKPRTPADLVWLGRQHR